MTPLQVGVIGCGYWGPNIIRALIEIPEASVRAVADRDADRLARVGSRFPQIPRLTQNHHELLAMGLDAVVVATPPETHFDLVMEALEHGLDVFVEKPLATDTEQARRMVEEAEARDHILMVGHIGAYNPAVDALREMVAAGELGDIGYIDAVRAGLGLFHPRLNVIWDLAPHDISILMHILGESPVSVSTRAIACVEPSIEDVAYMTLMFPSGVLAHVRLSWLDPCKTRRITVVGRRKMVLYDDVETQEKLKVYDKSVNTVPHTDTFGDFQFAYHYGSVVSPYVQLSEPLRLECTHFLESVLHHRRPLTDGHNGMQVVQAIEAAQRSLQSGGIQVPITGSEPVHLSDVGSDDGLQADGAEVPESVPVTSNGHAARTPGGDEAPTIILPS